MISLWKYFCLCEKLSWHISYDMKLWINDTKEGFDGGLVQFRKHCGFHYREVSKKSRRWWESRWRIYGSLGNGENDP